MASYICLHKELDWYRSPYILTLLEVEMAALFQCSLSLDFKCLANGCSNNIVGRVYEIWKQLVTPCLHTILIGFIINVVM